MDLKIILILTLVAVLCECRSARMTKEWPPSGKRSLNPWNRMSKTNKRDLNPWNRMSKTGEKRDAQGAVESLNPFNRMAPPDTFMHNRMANVQNRDSECSNLPPTSHEDISAEVSKINFKSKKSFKS